MRSTGGLSYIHVSRLLSGSNVFTQLNPEPVLEKWSRVNVPSFLCMYIEMKEHHEALVDNASAVEHRHALTALKIHCSLQVTAEAEGLSRCGRHVTNTAYFTFVSLNPQGRAGAVPPLKCQGAEEKARYQVGERRYADRKKARLVKAAAANKS